MFLKFEVTIWFIQSFSVRVKLVRNSEFPHSEAWLASSSGVDEYEFGIGIGIAMLVRHILPQVQIVNNGDGCICTDDNTGKIKICRYNMFYSGKN